MEIPTLSMLHQLTIALGHMLRDVWETHKSGNVCHRSENMRLFSGVEFITGGAS